MAQRNIEISALHEWLIYDPTSGILTWRKRGIPKWDAKWAGRIAGSLHSTGHWRVTVAYRRYYAHRIAWAMTHGKWPEQQVDHRDGDRLNNRICNLRLATNGENQQNVAIKKSNKSGFVGVVWFKPKQRWRAEIRANNRAYHLGYFDDPESAHAAYVQAKKRLHAFNPSIRGGGVRL